MTKGASVCLHPVATNLSPYLLMSKPCLKSSHVGHFFVSSKPVVKICGFHLTGHSAAMTHLSTRVVAFDIAKYFAVIIVALLGVSVCRDCDQVRSFTIP